MFVSHGQQVSALLLKTLLHVVLGRLFRKRSLSILATSCHVSLHSHKMHWLK